MTTSSEVKRWTGPLLEADPRLELVGRNLVLKPVGHFIRAVYIDRTGNRLRSNLVVYMEPLFSASSAEFSFWWSRDHVPYRSDDERFEAHFLELCRGGLNELGAIETIDDFLREAEKVGGRPFGPMPIRYYPLRHAEVLAAVGRFAEALSMMAPAMREEEETSGTMLASAEAELMKKPSSLLAKDSILRATRRLERVAELKPLLHSLEANDHAGLAALLRSQERHNAKVWKVDHLWEPTPFPFETG